MTRQAAADGRRRSHAYADTVIVTDDNPRPRKSAAIRRGGAGGRAGCAGYIGDRAEAIAHLAMPRSSDAGDALIIAGKGHEDTQTVEASPIRFRIAPKR